ncbi:MULTISPECIES: protease modulator HflC [Sutcliffiella]|uniref:protease modulator HflC n=1 Tax=Sutcliffiella TaxID=2837511 RepID=UPI0022DD7048|nr:MULTISPECIES: protease modulator HflC [Sutcliffiella]MED4016227.1 protease modulator HflC [Sutcliffiella cohnii]WBL14080.1 protease modulator HflC [Sutcliffiella sp. NC1]
MSDQNIIDIQERKPNFEWKKAIRGGIVLIIAFVVIGLLLANVYIVREGEFKVVRQFQAVVDVKNEPGLYVKIPFIQEVTTLPKYQMLYDVTEAEINTRDKKRMLIDNYVLWRIEDPQSMLRQAATVVNAEAKMSEFVFSVVRTELGRLNYDEIINDEKSSRGSLNDIVTERVNELLTKDNYGIVVTDVRIKRTDLPEENEHSVYTRMISERESTAQDYLSQGEAEKNRIIANTDREVREMLAIAEADADKIRGEGEQEAAKVYNDSFSKDAEFYQLYRTLESYKTTINGDTVIILPSDSPYARLLLGYRE